MVEKTKGKILITGLGGMLGNVFFQESKKRYSTIGTSKKDLDITDTKKVRQVILDTKPSIIVHTAALTNVDLCEQEPKLAYKINALGTKNIAHSSREIGAVLIYISTDYVFDGIENKAYKENSTPNPLSVYGQTKLDGEKFIDGELDNYIIIRSSWLFGKGKPGFIEKIIEQSKTQKVISVVSDKYGTPTFTLDLAKAILDIIYLIEKGQFSPYKNILHITNSGFCSWFEYAEKIINFIKAKDVTIKPVSLDDFSFKAKRPQFSALDNSYYNQLTGKPLRHWAEALKEYLNARAVKE